VTKVNPRIERWKNESQVDVIQHISEIERKRLASP
jgi:hypothetical protein